MKPRSAGYVKRWAAESMRHFALSHLPAFVRSRSPSVSPVSPVPAVPSLPGSVRAAAARVACLRLVSARPFELPAFVPALPPQASAWPGCHGSPVLFARPLLLGRVAGVALVRRDPSSAHRGRRIAGAGFRATGVACDGGGFGDLGRGAVPALAFARILPAS